jgi:hypothetical protein
MTTTTKTLGGVIAAITTAIDDKGEPDSARSTAMGSTCSAPPAKQPRSRWISANAS